MGSGRGRTASGVGDTETASVGGPPAGAVTPPVSGVGEPGSTHIPRARVQGPHRFWSDIATCWPPGRWRAAGGPGRCPSRCLVRTHVRRAGAGGTRAPGQAPRVRLVGTEQPAARIASLGSWGPALPCVRGGRWGPAWSPSWSARSNLRHLCAPSALRAGRPPRAAASARGTRTCGQRTGSDSSPPGGPYLGARPREDVGLRLRLSCPPEAALRAPRLLRGAPPSSTSHARPARSRPGSVRPGPVRRPPRKAGPHSRPRFTCGSPLRPSHLADPTSQPGGSSLGGGAGGRSGLQGAGSWEASRGRWHPVAPCGQGAVILLGTALSLLQAASTLLTPQVLLPTPPSPRGQTWGAPGLCSRDFRSPAPHAPRASVSGFKATPCGLGPARTWHVCVVAASFARPPWWRGQCEPDTHFRGHPTSCPGGKGQPRPRARGRRAGAGRGHRPCRGARRGGDT